MTGSFAESNRPPVNLQARKGMQISGSSGTPGHWPEGTLRTYICVIHVRLRIIKYPMVRAGWGVVRKVSSERQQDLSAKMSNSGSECRKRRSGAPQP